MDFYVDYPGCAQLKAGESISNAAVNKEDARYSPKESRTPIVTRPYFEMGGAGNSKGEVRMS
jgi:hypothetical protein